MKQQKYRTARKIVNDSSISNFKIKCLNILNDVICETMLLIKNEQHASISKCAIAYQYTKDTHEEMIRIKRRWNRITESNKTLTKDRHM